jgi:hypothetical protein
MNLIYATLVANVIVLTVNIVLVIRIVYVLSSIKPAQPPNHPMPEPSWEQRLDAEAEQVLDFLAAQESLERKNRKA